MQEALPLLSVTKGPAIDRYERGVAKPIIEVVCKITNKSGASLNYLVGNSQILEVQNLPEVIKKKINYFFDISIKEFKVRQA